MMATFAKDRWILAGAFLTLQVLIFCEAGCTGCKDEGCKTHSDCPAGRFCVNGRCEEAMDTGETAEAETDRDSEGESGEEDSGSGAKTGDSDSDGHDTDTSECAGDASDGERCSAGCDCVSGHCQGGVCCESGECCGNSEDCRDDLCRVPLCADNTCSYLAMYDCGEEDADGVALCREGEVCNGEGACVPLAIDCGGYRSNGDFVCDSEGATSGCYASCTEENASGRCAAGAVCEDGRCVFSDAASDGEACEADEDCRSGHCQNGFCCVDGECCGSVDDCASGCRTALCGEATGYRCEYVYTPCGYGHSDSGCTGGERCDGLGGCVVLETCEAQGSAYTADGEFICESGGVMESCSMTCEAHIDCASGYDCDFQTHTCLTADGGGCVTDDDCFSAHCENGVCCAAGRCCVDNGDCTAPCAEDQVCDSVTHSCEAGTLIACGEEHTVGDLNCGGESRCDGHGRCAEITDDCEGDYSTGAPYTCAPASAPPRVERRCYNCESDRDCDDNTDFCDGFYRCLDHSCRFDVPVAACPEDNPCGTWTCNETTDECVVSDNPCAGLGEPCVPQRCIVQGDTHACVADPLEDGDLCDDGIGCNGAGDTCLEGRCVPGPLDRFACYDGDPCTTDTCTESGTGAPECANTPINVGDPCSEEYQCFGENATCQLDAGRERVVCVNSAAVCGEGGVCMSHECTENFWDNGLESTCDTRSASRRGSLACGESIVLQSDDFTSRLYFDYGTVGDPCYSGAGAYAGMEALVDIPLDSGTAEATVAVTDVSPSSYDADIEIMMFNTDECDEAQCAAHGSNRLTFATDVSFVVLVVDSFDLWPPESLTLALTCGVR